MIVCTGLFGVIRMCVCVYVCVCGSPRLGSPCIIACGSSKLCSCFNVLFFSVSFQEKPHKCSLCAKSFPTPGDLKSHMYVHSGSWPHKCHICSRGFSKHTNLKNHLFLHTGKQLMFVSIRCLFKIFKKKMCCLVNF